MGSVGQSARPKRAQDALLAARDEVSASERFEKLRKDRRAEFFVVNSLDELLAQGELQRMLDERFPTLARTDRYVIYDLRTPRGTAETGDHAETPRR